MKLSGMSLFQLASQRMTWLGARQSVISENIANADTPHYRAREVSSFGEMVEGSTRPQQGMALTNMRHIPGSTSAPDGVRISEDADAWESAIGGNNVVLEQQTIKSSEVAGSYRLAADLYRKGHDLLTVAVTGVR
ncbi:flagellar basal body rod protein FlgB [Salipiger pallidus]|uniref:Flagellar basal body rod protein FlgB n=1 Tax=Salipiger pallidus TaxID=1775170 RepID=A0A8J3EFR4_9RHOB|nr:flagellar basal body protein [Salipiger pallidus]GGG67552.1 flagellar basal body rod protein FlgB [Salipiger pallidus]